ncbi:MAG: glycosyltransferase family 39 protein [Acidobacteria bacterium]|nr:glycosyltransferase family 39 protein [Acidobacteriota bacterium]
MTVSPASRRERILVVAAFAVLALLRLATLAPDPWEWDEVLFMEGVRDGLDVRVNHPHPPGYPVFIRLGQGIRALGAPPFRATALAGAIGGYLSVLALYLLLRELGSRRAWALVGALFYALTPSVWLHGVRPLSDGPGAAAGLFAAVFLVRAIAGKGRHALLWAAAFTALAAGVRPQVGLALLPAAAVAAVSVFRRERSVKPLLLAAAVGVLLSAAIWIPVFRSSGGFAVWKDRFEGQMKYVTQFDSPKLRDVLQPPFWKRWFLDPVGHGKLAGTFLLLGLAGAALERKRAGMVFLVFVPVTLLTLGVLSVDSAPRYVLAFWAAPCALAAFALERFAASRFGRIVSPAAGVLVLAAFAALGAPAIAEVASKPSPSVAAMQAVRAAGVPPGDVFVTEPLRAHADEYFRYRAHVVSETIPVAVPRTGVFVGAEDRPFGVVPQRVFTFESPRLLHISRGRYLRTEIFEGRAGAGVFVPITPWPATQLDGRVELPEGTTFSIYAASPADVTFMVRAAGERAELELKTLGGARTGSVEPGGELAVTFGAAPDPSEKLFTISALKGRATLDAFRIRAHETHRPAYRADDAIPAGLDEPAEGARIALPLRARGWCQEKGGGRVDPVEFRLDGLRIVEVTVTRMPRPDVAAVLPAIGDAREAGWEAVLSPRVGPGRHVLTVTFQAGDRRRVYPPREIEIVTPGGAK